MAFGARARLVNPRLGTYFSIFAALFTALFLLILIFEQLRFRRTTAEAGFLRRPNRHFCGNRPFRRKR